MHSLRGEDSPQPLGPALWEWQKVNRVLVIRLRSIGDTVLSTPALFALKRFLPHATIDILLEDWVAPVLDGFASVDNVITIERNSTRSRARVARELRAKHYDVVFNLHGGSTSTLLTRATGAPHRVGFATYQYARLHNHIAPSPLLLWNRETTHSVEQQLAMVGWTGVPVTDRPPTKLSVTEAAARAVGERLRAIGLADAQFAVLHPAAAFETKQWAAENFARVAEVVLQRGLPVIVVTTPAEAALVDLIQKTTSGSVHALTDLSIPQVTALLSRARLFVGNDSGIAHIAAAVAAPTVVVFGSSNRAHWSPWSTAPSEVVYEELDCQPCHGYFCEKFDAPECIKRVPVERVIASVDRILATTRLGTAGVPPAMSAKRE